MPEWEPPVPPPESEPPPPPESEPPVPPVPPPSPPFALGRGASCHVAMRGLSGEQYSSLSVSHVVAALPAAVGHAGRAFGRVSARVQEADIDGDAMWSAGELWDLLEPMLEEAGVAPAAQRDRILRDTLRGCVAW